MPLRGAYSKDPFSAFLSETFCLDGTALKEIFEVAEFESVVKIELVQITADQDPIFSQTFGITR